MKSQKDLDPHVFCTLPFVHINNLTLGEIAACCHSANPILKPNSSAFNLTEGDTYESAFRSEYMDKLRKNMLSGVRDPQCQQCWKHEDLGLPSKRIVDGARFMDRARAALAHETLPFAPASWDIKVGMHCNLRCRMCNGETSSAILSEAVAHGWYGEGQARSILSSAGNLLSQSFVKDELKRIIAYAEEVYFLGGEPTLNLEHLELLDTAIASGASKYMTVRWSTNLARFDDRLVSRAKEFRNVRVDCSIDGYGSVNEYVRYPMSWTETEARILKLRRSLPDANIVIVYTVQTYNIFEMERMLTWIQENELSIGLNFLSEPEYLAAYQLPDRIKEMVCEKYKSMNSRELDAVCTWLMSKRTLPNLSRFYSYTESLDKVRNQDFFSIVPEPFRSALLADRLQLNRLAGYQCYHPKSARLESALPEI